MRTNPRQILLYLVFGVLTTAVNVATYYVLVRVAGVPYLASNVVAWFASVAFAYATNRAWVFDSRASGTAELAREFSAFVTSRLATGALDMVLMYLLVGVASFDDVPAKVFVNVVVVVLNFVLSKLVVFREAPDGSSAV